MNIKFKYMYCNYLNESKQDFVIFRDPLKRGVVFLDRHIKRALYLSRFFLAEDLRLPPCYTYEGTLTVFGKEIGPEENVDHPCHEYLGIVCTEAPVTDPTNRRITDFIATMRAKRLNAEMAAVGWI